MRKRKETPKQRPDTPFRLTEIEKINKDITFILSVFFYGLAVVVFSTIVLMVLIAIDSNT